MSGYVVDGVHRCVICSGRLLYRPEDRDVCEGCRKLRGDLTELSPLEYRPMVGEPCPLCGFPLDPGTRRHPDCLTPEERDERKGKGRGRL